MLKIARLGILALPVVVGVMTCAVFGQGETPKPPARQEIGQPKPEDFRSPLRNLKALPTNKTSVKSNGVEMTIEVEPEEQKDTTDFLIKWELRYSGPRSPLIITQPSLTLTTNSTMVFMHAVPKNSNYVWTALVHSPIEDVAGAVVIDAYSEETKLPPDPNWMGPIADPTWRTRVKEFFIEVPKHGARNGTMRVSGAKLKKLFTKNTRDLTSQEAPNMYITVRHFPCDRGEDFNLDAWTGSLTTETLKVAPFKKW